MSLTRRGFLKVAFAAGIATAVPLVIGENLPTIYGDGIHDDTEGLQAAFDGKAFHCRGDLVRVSDGHIEMTGGHYLTTKTLIVPENAGYFRMNGCRLTCKLKRAHGEDAWAIEIRGSRAWLQGVTILTDIERTPELSSVFVEIRSPTFEGGKI